MFYHADETLRIYPSVTTLTRVCVKDYKLRDMDLTIEKGIKVMIPLYTLHNDPEYFPEPGRFDPDRFSDENKRSMHPYTHLPFGDGPRNCIGLRFGIMQSKVGLAAILSRFRLKISPSTRLPLRLDEGVLMIKTLDTLFYSSTVKFPPKEVIWAPGPNGVGVPFVLPTYKQLRNSREANRSKADDAFRSLWNEVPLRLEKCRLLGEKSRSVLRPTSPDAKTRPEDPVGVHPSQGLFLSWLQPTVWVASSGARLFLSSPAHLTFGCSHRSHFLLTPLRHRRDGLDEEQLDPQVMPTLRREADR
ncbi:hypothetical protein NQ315_017026 [Exocentrus adspersus]|uniref:Cytochrome P450 n=1 Tax=Exocentrus adspersus TaxID=1586481 RepID=A0AAV8VBC9_9CUCU|nr:hypothetical protein NQ315_017026 [Exocentrus adspersus]